MRFLAIPLIPMLLACLAAPPSEGAPPPSPPVQAAQAVPRPVNRAELDYNPGGVVTPSPAAPPQKVSPDAVEKALAQAGSLGFVASGGRSPVASLSCQVRWENKGTQARVEGQVVSRLNGDLKPAHAAEVAAVDLQALVAVALEQKVMELPAQAENSTARDLFTYTFTLNMGGEQKEVTSYGANSGATRALRDSLERACHMDELIRSAHPRR